jgi:hypothetical protein
MPLGCPGTFPEPSQYATWVEWVCLAAALYGHLRRPDERPGLLFPPMFPPRHPKRPRGIKCPSHEARPGLSMVPRP